MLFGDLRRAVALAGAAVLLVSCGSESPDPSRLAASGDDGSGRAAPSESTRRANAAVLDALPFEDEQDFEDAGRGFRAEVTSHDVAKAICREWAWKTAT